MKKGQIGVGIINRVEFPNKGILYTDEGEKVIIKNCVPGQKIKFSIRKKRKGKCEGHILEVLEHSPMELSESACEHFGKCGGCVYQNLSYEKQLELKADQVKDLLAEVVKEAGCGKRSAAESREEIDVNSREGIYVESEERIHVESGEKIHADSRVGSRADSRVESRKNLEELETNFNVESGKKLRLVQSGSFAEENLITGLEINSDAGTMSELKAEGRQEPDAASIRKIVAEDRSELDAAGIRAIGTESGKSPEAVAGTNFEAESGTNFKAESGTNFEAESGINFEAESGINFEAESGINFKAESGINFEAEFEQESDAGGRSLGIIRTNSDIVYAANTNMDECGGDCLAWFEGIQPSPKQFEYRNKMEYSFGDEYKDGPLTLGMHKRDSFYDLVTVEKCRIVDLDFNCILKAVLSYFTQKEISYFKKNSHEGYLRHLLVRKAEKTGEILIDLVTTTQPCGMLSEKELLEGFQKTVLDLKLRGKIAGILHTRNDSIADAVKDEGTEILYGQDYFYEELLGLRFKISAFSFFQTNSLGAEVLYETVREFIGSSGLEQGSVVYDLYSGTGTIAQMLAPAAGRVIGVEIVEEAVQAARENVGLNGLENCKFIAGDVLKVLETIEEKPDFIVLDPPREGVHPKALERILDYGVERMVYISCKPTSLARDLRIMQERGYIVERGRCVDMFPGTVHVEVAVLLTRTDT